MALVIVIEPGVREIDLDDLVDDLINSHAARPFLAAVIASLVARTIKADELLDLANARVKPTDDRMESKLLALVEPTAALIDYLEKAENYERVTEGISN